MPTIMYCHVCKARVELQAHDGDCVWTVFCSPEEAYAWQSARTEDEIIEQTSGPGMPYDRCQWCGCTLKSGYHNNDCPVRLLAEEPK